jgi:hypothetical protein
MPAYPGSSQATLIRTNQQQYFWNQESVASGTLSHAFQLERITGTYYKWGLSVAVVFSGAPGIFEVDIMGANNDLAANFVQLGTITAVDAGFAGRWDMPSNLWPKYVAAFLKTLTNAVTVTAQVTR